MSRRRHGNAHNTQNMTTPRPACRPPHAGTNIVFSMKKKKKKLTIRGTCNTSTWPQSSMSALICKVPLSLELDRRPFLFFFDEKPSTSWKGQPSLFLPACRRQSDEQTTEKQRLNISSVRGLRAGQTLNRYLRTGPMLRLFVLQCFRPSIKYLSTEPDVISPKKDAATTFGSQLTTATSKNISSITRK